MILSTLPTDGFLVSTGPGNIASGAAVAFAPQNDCNLSSATLLLQGYDGLNGQQISLQFCENNQTNGPVPLTDFACPPHNDGSLAAFTFNLEPATFLKGGMTYWIFIYGRLNDTNFSHQVKIRWVNGMAPSGDIIYKGSLEFFQNSFSSSQICPAFLVNTIRV